MKRIFNHLFILLFFAAQLGCKSTNKKQQDNILDLSGQWQVQLQKNTLQSYWLESEESTSIELPGSIQAQGVGYDVDENTEWLGLAKSWQWIKNSGRGKDGVYRIPAWLQPEKYYRGNAWYQREFEVPGKMSGLPLFLHLERVHTSTTVWIDGNKVGSDNSLSAPHRFAIGELTPGEHKITICVDNRKPAEVGNNAHSVSDHTQTTWNGIIGKIELQALPGNHMKGVHLYPDVDNKRVRVKIDFAGNSFPTGASLKLQMTSPNGDEWDFIIKKGNEKWIELGEKMTLWSEFTPNLYKLSAELTSPSGAKQVITEKFGMVKYERKGQAFYVNGVETFLRGTLDCASFPLTGYPSTDPEYWRKVYETCKNHGLNHVRFHSWCPPKVAFEVADEVGIYLMAEHAWSQSLGHGRPVDNYLIREGQRAVEEFGNHPSFMIHAYGNEPSGKEGAVPYLTKWIDEIRKTDGNRRLYTSAAGWSVTENSDFSDVMTGLRVYPWGAGLNSDINKWEPETFRDFSEKTATDDRPFVAHENGQWCVYPNFEEIKKYTGVLKPRNYEIFQMNLNENHMGDQAHDFLMASGRLQTICYKYEIEKLLRTPGVAGYQLLGLNDFPGQGTALVGAVDVFWETKPYTSAKEYSQFNGSTVPLAKFSKFVYTKDEVPEIPVDIAHYGATPLTNAAVRWQVLDLSGKVLLEDVLVKKNITVGLSNLKGSLKLNLNTLPAPAQYKFVVSIDGTDAENAWDFWVYPEKVSQQAGNVKITRDKEEALKLLAKGEKVLLIPKERELANRGHNESVLGFSTIFWNTVWANNQPPTTMGILCEPKHPAFDEFPTEYHSNYQWWYLIKKASGTINLDGQQPKLRPLVQIIDDWFENRRLGLVVEANHGKGKLVISSIDISTEFENYPVLSQFRSSLLNYMNSDDFKPEVSITKDEFTKFFNAASAQQNLYEVQTKDQSEKHPVINVIDNNPRTFWHTNWEGSVEPYPHYVQLKGQEAATYSAIRFLPRQDNSNGAVKEIAVLVSMDGEKWEEVAQTSLPKNLKWQQLDFKPTKARYIRVEMLSPHNPNHPWASMAEIELVREER